MSQRLQAVQEENRKLAVDLQAGDEIEVQIMLRNQENEALTRTVSAQRAQLRALEDQIEELLAIVASGEVRSRKPVPCACTLPAFEIASAAQPPFCVRRQCHPFAECVGSLCQGVLILRDFDAQVGVQQRSFAFRGSGAKSGRHGRSRDAKRRLRGAEEMVASGGGSGSQPEPHDRYSRDGQWGAGRPGAPAAPLGRMHADPRAARWEAAGPPPPAGRRWPQAWDHPGGMGSGGGFRRR